MNAKKLILLPFLFVFTFALHALDDFAYYSPNGQKVNLTKSDITSAAKNIKALEKEFDKFEKKFEMGLVTAENIEAELTQIFNKYGISESNAIAKFGVIALGAEYAELKNEFTKKPKKLDFFNSIGIDPYASTKNLIHADDLEVIEKNLLALAIIQDELD